MQNEIYLRMLVLLLPFIDSHFFDQTIFNNYELEERILLSIKYYGHIDNIDKVKNIVKLYYPKSKYNIDDFFDIIRELSDSLLTYHNDNIVVDNFDHDMSYRDILYPFRNKILPFIEINKLVSDHLLIVIYNYHHHYDIEYILSHDLIRPISVVNFHLENILKKGLAETHTHLIGSIPFDTQWAWIMDKLKDDSYPSANELIQIMSKNKSKLQYHKKSLDIQADLGKVILYSSVIRTILIDYIAFSKIESNISFYDYVLFMIKKAELNYEEGKYINILINSFRDNNFNNDEINLELHFRVIRKIFDLNENQFMCSLYQNLSNDAIHVISKNKKNNDQLKNIAWRDYSQIEFLFLYVCYDKYQNSPNDLFFKSALFQYIRYKNMFHILINQSSEIKGFFEFQMYFGSQHSLIDASSLMFTPIFQTYAYDNVKYLEIRVGHVRPSSNQILTIDNVKKTILQTFKKFINAYIEYLDNEDHQTVQAGIILHFNKIDDEINKCWYDYVLYKDKKLLYYEKYRQECFLNLAVLTSIRSQIAYADKYIIGIDAASNELLTEPWVLAPVFKSVKDKWQNILYEKMEYYDLKANRCFPLGITYHVGEVFNSVVSGLRHVDEVVEHYGFQNGERLGHATIIGLDTDKYSKEKKIVTLPVIELLDNWLWLYHLKSEYNLFRGISSSYIEENIWKMVHLIYEAPNGHIIGNINVHKLYEAYNMQFEENNINMDFFEECDLGEKPYPCYFVKEENSWSSLMLYYSRHCQCYLKKMNQIVQVDIDNDIQRQMYREAQQYLCQKIANRGIVVEVNPISNLYIGEIENIYGHTITRLNDTYKDENVENHIITTINADNPGVFSTTLRNQFGFIEQLLLEKGFSSEQVLKWIDHIRKNGLNSTFIHEKNKSKEEILNELKIILNEIRLY